MFSKQTIRDIDLHGKTVLLRADYNVPLAAAANEAGRAALLVLNSAPQSLATLSAPDLVIVSKPDLYDNQDAVANYVGKNPYTRAAIFPAFTIWQRNSGLSGGK